MLLVQAVNQIQLLVPVILNHNKWNTKQNFDV